MQGFDKKVKCGLRRGENQEVNFNKMMDENKVEFIEKFKKNKFWLR